MNNEELDRIINNYKKHAIGYFEDQFSEITWKRQSILLLSSVLTILVSLKVVNPPIEGEFLGISVSFTQPSAITILGGVVTLYFLAIYILSVLQDLTKAEINKLPSDLGMIEILNNLRGKMSEQNAIVNEKSLNLAEEILPKRLEKQKVLDQIDREHDAKIRPLLDKSHELTSELLDTHNFALIEPLNAIHTQIDELQQKHKKERIPHEIVDMNSGEIKDSGKQITNELKQATKEIKAITSLMKLLRKTWNRKRRFQNFQKYLEVVFPVLLGIIASALSALSIFAG